MSRTERPEIDATWLEHTLLALLRTPTGVPDNQTEVAPGDPSIIEAIDQVLLPLIDSLGPDEVRRHRLGDVAARFGPPGDAGLLVQTYIVSQHGNLMDDPLAARIVDGDAYGLSGRAALGQGANQNKGPMAAVMAAFRTRPEKLSHPVWLAINTEGRSSHGGSQRIIDDLGIRARFGIVSISTDLNVSVGNRGRVDVRITVPGESCHSSQPWLGSNPIPGAASVVRSLDSAPLPEPHPQLGAASATPYQLACSPIAPHTIPSEAVIVVDRRMLPGEHAGEVVSGLRAHLAATVSEPHVVEEGAIMLPAAVDSAAPVVTALRAAVEDLADRPSSAFWSRNTFDAGYACSKGIPTCMFGPGVRSFSKDLTAAEIVSVHDCIVAAGAVKRTIAALCA